MYGVPAASTATTAALFLVGIALAVVAGFRVRGRYRGEERFVALAVVLSLIAVPWVGWRFAEDLSTTTRLDAYTRANAGPIQAYLPGYLVDAAKPVVGRRQTWAAVTGAGLGNSTAARAFPALVLTELFPRVSAPVRSADWLLAVGIEPRAVTHVTGVRVIETARGVLPPVRLAKVDK